MPFVRPTLEELIVRAENDIKGHLGVKNVLRRTFLGIIAFVLAGLAHLLFGFLKFIEKNAFPDTAEDEFLERWAGIWGVEKLTATFAQFTLDVTGTDGTLVPATEVYRREDGVEFTVDVNVTISGGVGTLALTAVTAGRNGNVTTGQTISVLSPIPGLDSDGTVNTIEIEAEDTETNDSLRSRLLDRIQNPPSGGAANDYIQWAKSVAGVTRAWVLPLNTGPGTVGVSFVEDDDNPITPDAAKLTEVSDFIEALRPVTANVTVFAPNLLPIDLDISLKPNTIVEQTAVIAQLEDLILRDAALVGAYKSPTEQHTGKILVSRINEAISIAVGEQDHVLNLVNGVAPADVEPAVGQLAVLGAITWQPLA